MVVLVWSTNQSPVENLGIRTFPRELLPPTWFWQIRTGTTTTPLDPETTKVPLPCGVVGLLGIVQPVPHEVTSPLWAQNVVDLFFGEVDVGTLRNVETNGSLKIVNLEWGWYWDVGGTCKQMKATLAACERVPDLSMKIRPWGVRSCSLME